MDKDTDSGTAAQRTVFPAEEDKLDLWVWVSPPRCGGCGGRVDTFYRYGDRHDEAKCSECGEEWLL